MKSLALIHDMLRGIEPVERRNLIALISSVKVLLDNAERLDINTDYSWNMASLNRECFLEALYQIQKATGLEIYNRPRDIKSIRNLDNFNFEKIIDIANAAVNSYDIEGYCRELKNTANVSGKIYDNTTPDRVLDIPIRIIEPKISDSIADFFNGESGTEIALKRNLGLKDKDGGRLNYYGAEIDESSFAIGQLVNFLITGDIDRIIHGDSIADDIFEGKCFDICISNPPFMLKSDKYRNEYIIINGKERFRYGSKYYSPASMDWVIIDLILSSLKEGGKAAVLLSMGAMFRAGIEEKIRKRIINDDVVEAVIKIPSSVIPNTSVDSCWIIFNKDKEEKRRGRVQFIDISNYEENVDRRNKTVSKDGVDKAVKAYRSFKEDDISFILDEIKIAGNSYRLDAFEYIKNEKLMKSISDMRMVEFWNVALIRRGVQVNKGKLDTLNTGSERTHYLISLGNIINGEIVVSEADKIQIERKWSGIYDVKEGDILITSKGTLFKAAIVDSNIKAIVSSNLFIIRCYENKYVPEVLKYYLESELGQRLISGILKGGVVKSISTRDLERFPVPDIDIKLQREIEFKIKKSKEEYARRIKKAHEAYKNEQEEIKKKLNFTLDN